MRRILFLIIGLVPLAFPVLAQDTPDFSDPRAAIEAEMDAQNAPGLAVAEERVFSLDDPVSTIEAFPPGGATPASLP